MDKITNLTQINYVVVILWFFALLFGIKEIIELISYFKGKFKIKTGADEERETTEERITTLEEHDRWQYDEISKISQGINDIKEQLKDHDKKDKERIVATLRNQLYSLHSKFIEHGYVDESGLKTFLELGKIYEESGGNDIYHDKLKPEVMNLPIRDNE